MVRELLELGNNPFTDNRGSGVEISKNTQYVINRLKKTTNTIGLSDGKLNNNVNFLENQFLLQLNDSRTNTHEYNLRKRI